MLVILPEHHPFLGPFPPLSLAVNYHDDDDESIDELPRNNPADETDDDNNGSAYGDNNDDDGAVRDNTDDGANNDDMEYEDDDVAADDGSEDDKQRCGKVGDNSDEPVYSHSINDVPGLHRRIIEEAPHIDWDIDTPCDFQVFSINQGAFQDNTVMYLISKTVSGNLQSH